MPALGPRHEDALLRTGDVVFLIARSKALPGSGVRPVSQYGLITSPLSFLSMNMRAAALRFSPISNYGDAMQPFILRAARDGVGTETRTVEYLPSGFAIGSEHLLFLEAVSDSGTNPLMLVPRPTALGIPFRAWGTASEAALIAACQSSFPSRAMALKIDATRLISGEEVGLLSRFGQLTLMIRGDTTGMLSLLAGVLDSEYTFVFRKYAPSYVFTDEGCRLLDATTTALTPIWCGSAPPFESPCQLSTGEYLFWHIADCEAAHKDRPNDKRQGEPD